jgi:hypothetical protein
VPISSPLLIASRVYGIGPGYEVIVTIGMVIWTRPIPSWALPTLMESYTDIVFELDGVTVQGLPKMHK